MLMQVGVWVSAAFDVLLSAVCVLVILVNSALRAIVFEVALEARCGSFELSMLLIAAPFRWCLLQRVSDEVIGSDNLVF